MCFVFFFSRCSCGNYVVARDPCRGASVVVSLLQQPWECKPDLKETKLASCFDIRSGSNHVLNRKHSKRYACTTCNPPTSPWHNKEHTHTHTHPTSTWLLVSKVRECLWTRRSVRQASSVVQSLLDIDGPGLFGAVVRSGIFDSTGSSEAPKGGCCSMSPFHPAIPRGGHEIKDHSTSDSQKGLKSKLELLIWQSPWPSKLTVSAPKEPFQD